MKLLLQLFGSYFKIGLFSIGGGLAMVPLLVTEFERRGWLSPDEFFEILTLSQMTPGAIAVNAATYVGHDVGGFMGSVFATTGLAAPSVLLIIALFPILLKLKNNTWKDAFFSGMKPVTIALILFAGYTIIKETFWVVETKSVDLWGLFLVLFFTALLQLFPRIHPILFISAGAVVGMVLF